MLIEVTQDDIDAARAYYYGNCKGDWEGNCAVALALRRQGFPKALVCLNHLQLEGCHSPSIRHPRLVRTFVRTPLLEQTPFRFNIGKGWGRAMGGNMNVKVIPASEMILLPPHPSKCQTCAVDHPEDQPHNAQSLFYQTKFNMENKRGATWMDAMAHCTKEVKEMWTEELLRLGINVAAGQIAPPKEGTPMALAEAKKLMKALITYSRNAGREGKTIEMRFGRRVISVHRLRHPGTRAVWKVDKVKWTAKDVLELLTGVPRKGPH